MKKSRLSILALSAASSLLSGCAFHSTAREWNDRVGPDGEPTYLTSTTNVGVNFLVVFKALGSTDTVGMIDEITGEIAEEGGDRVRIVQSSSENYWYGFPPFTWIITPVVTTVAADYIPSPEAIAAYEAELAAEAEAED